jgi:hypothetical protein
MNYLETWQEIKARHVREKVELVSSLATDYTITQAANILKMDYKTLVRFCDFYGITFKQSQKQNNRVGCAIVSSDSKKGKTNKTKKWLLPQPTTAIYQNER